MTAYKVHIWDSSNQRIANEKTFTNISEARKYGYRILKKYPVSARDKCVEISFNGDLFVINEYNGEVLYSRPYSTYFQYLYPDGSLSDKMEF